MVAFLLPVGVNSLSYILHNSEKGYWITKIASTMAFSPLRVQLKYMIYKCSSHLRQWKKCFVLFGRPGKVLTDWMFTGLAKDTIKKPLENTVTEIPGPLKKTFLLRAELRWEVWVAL